MRFAVVRLALLAVPVFGLGACTSDLASGAGEPVKRPGPTTAVADAAVGTDVRAAAGPDAVVRPDDAATGSPDAMTTGDRAALSAGDATDAPGGSHPSQIVFDDKRVETYVVSVAAADWQKLQDTILLEQYVPATLKVGNEDIGRVAIRYKGYFTTLRGCVSNGKIICKKMSFKVSLNEYEPDKRYRGLKKLNFNSMKADDTLLHERLAYQLFRDMGLLAPRAVHANLVINGEAKGLYTLAENIDGRFTDYRFSRGEGDGNLYKEVWPVSADPQYYAVAQKTNEGVVAPTRFVAFANALSAASEADLSKTVSAWIDPAYALKFIAVDEAIKNWDGPRYFPCNSAGTTCRNINFYVYESQAANRFWPVAYDFDMTFWPTKASHDTLPAWNQPVADCTKRLILEGRPFQPAWCDRVFRGLAGLGKDRYTQAVRELLDGPFDLAKLNAALDTWSAQIAGLVRADASGPSFDVWRAAVDKLKADLMIHRRRMEAIRDAR